MIPFTELNRPDEGKFAFVITKGGQIYGGQISYDNDLICFIVYINGHDIDGHISLVDVKEWMYSPELEKYYNF